MLTMEAGRRRRFLTIAAGVVAVVGLVIGLVVFKPWLLFVDVRVDEHLPIVATSTEQAEPSPSAPSSVPVTPAATSAALHCRFSWLRAP